MGIFNHQRVRNRVSDETKFFLAMFSGVGLGSEFYIRYRGNLYRRTMGNEGIVDENLGSQNKIENLRLYYRDSRDAKLVERVRMALGF